MRQRISGGACCAVTVSVVSLSFVLSPFPFMLYDNFSTYYMSSDLPKTALIQTKSFHMLEKTNEHISVMYLENA